MGKLEARQRLTVVRRLWFHDSRGPRGVLDQSIDRISLPISPPPTSQSCALLFSRRALAPYPDCSIDIRSFSTPEFHIGKRDDYARQVSNAWMTEYQPR